jgi:predicted porin
MKKSLLALAVLGACAGFAQAQTAVVVYGTIDLGVVKRTDQTLNIGKRANNMLGFKGTEDLGNGLKAIFAIETRFEPDTGTNELGTGNAQRPLFQGQTRVGLQGDFGMVRFGRGLTAFQESSAAYEPFHGIPSPVGFATDLTIGGYSSDPFNGASASINRFSNALFYNSPLLAGAFQINSTIGTKEGNGGLTVVGNKTFPGGQGSVNPFSLSTTYANGPVAAMLAYERNAVQTKVLSIAGSVMAAPDLKLMASYTRQDQGYTKTSNTKTKAWVIGANYMMGASKFMAGYGQKSPDGVIKTKQFSLGYEYALSKRTYVYMDASRKEANTTAATPLVSTKINTIDVGVNHAF